MAAAFHDLGVWSDAAWDYLPPSIRRMRAYLTASGRASWSDELAVVNSKIDAEHFVPEELLILPLRKRAVRSTRTRLRHGTPSWSRRPKTA